MDIPEKGNKYNTQPGRTDMEPGKRPSWWTTQTPVERFFHLNKITTAVLSFIIVAIASLAHPPLLELLKILVSWQVAIFFAFLILVACFRDQMANYIDRIQEARIKKGDTELSLKLIEKLAPAPINESEIEELRMRVHACENRGREDECSAQEREEILKTTLEAFSKAQERAEFWETLYWVTKLESDHTRILSTINKSGEVRFGQLQSQLPAIKGLTDKMDALISLGFLENDRFVLKLTAKGKKYIQFILQEGSKFRSDPTLFAEMLG
jgi:hypothetical protein